MELRLARILVCCGRIQIDRALSLSISLCLVLIRSQYSSINVIRPIEMYHNSVGKAQYKLFCKTVPGLACNYFFFFSAVFQNIDSDTKLNVKDATYAITPANSMSRRFESNGRRPGPGFGRNTKHFVLLTRAILREKVIVVFEDSYMSPCGPWSQAPLGRWPSLRDT